MKFDIVHFWQNEHSIELCSVYSCAVQTRLDCIERWSDGRRDGGKECKQKGRLGEGRQSDIGENIKFNQINSQVHPKTNTSSSRPKNCSLSMANKLKGHLYNVHQHQDSPLHRSFPHHNNKCFYICLAVSVQPNANCKMWSQISFSLQLQLQKVWEDSGCQIWLAPASCPTATAPAAKAANPIRREDLDAEV